MGARYSRNSGYTIAKRTAPRTTVRTVQRRVKFGPNAAKFIGIAILAALAFFMITTTSNSTTVAYKQNQIRQDLSNVNDETQGLQLDAQRLQSITAEQGTSAAQTEQADQLVPIGNPDYVTQGDVAGVSTTKP